MEVNDIMLLPAEMVLDESSLSWSNGKQKSQLGRTMMA
jgi:hypothetical protein